MADLRCLLFIPLDKYLRTLKYTTQENTMASIGFIGVGKLGQACAEMVAEVHDVVGYDVNPVEPENFTMVNKMEDAVRGQDIVFVAVPTPHDPQYDGKAPTSHLPNKDFDYTIVKDILSKVNAVATNEQLIVLISTVLPGTVRREFIPLLPNARFVYNPYLIAMGTVKWDMVNPEMVMIGTSDGSETGDAKELVDFYKTIMQNEPRYIIGTWDECECIKVFYNTFISAKVSLVNMIQDVAEKQGNINAEVVCDALASSDRRIMGPGYMKPGMGDGGACHPRDNIALRWMAEELNLGYDLFDAVMLSREKQAENMAIRLMQLAQEVYPEPVAMPIMAPIVIIGKAYKPLVPYEAGSASMLVGHYIEASGQELYYLDEQTGDMPPQEVLDNPAVYLMAHNPAVTYGEQLDTVPGWYGEHTATDCDGALTVATGNGSELTFAEKSVILDPWRTLPEIEGCTVIHYGNTRKIK
jgi:UDPglucose 6-dehydrogenase